MKPTLIRQLLEQEHEHEQRICCPNAKNRSKTRGSSSSSSSSSNCINMLLIISCSIIIVSSSSSMLTTAKTTTTTTTTAAAITNAQQTITTTTTATKTLMQLRQNTVTPHSPIITTATTAAASNWQHATTTTTTTTTAATATATTTIASNRNSNENQNSDTNFNSNWHSTYATNWSITNLSVTLATSAPAAESDEEEALLVNEDELQNLYDDELSFHQYCIAHRNSFADLFTLVLYTIVCIIGLFGNTLVIYVVLRFSKMQTVTNIYILNLAIADECFLIGIPFLLYTMRICSWRFGEFMCKAYMVSTSITQFTSSIFLLIMSADRYIAVCHPISSTRYRTLHIAKIVSALAWSTSAVLMLPVILYASTVSQEDGINLSCNIEWPESYKKHSGTTFILYTFFLGFATPLCFILCFYYLVIRKLQSVGPKTNKSKEKKRAHRKVTRLVLTVITVYICCWLPHWISQVALINSNPAQRDLSRLEILIFLLLGCLVYSNSAMNPILYAFLSDNFRKSFFKAFTCMTGHDINAQLHVEPSIFTKQGSRRRGGSRRLLSAPQQPMLGCDSGFAGAGGGGGGGGAAGSHSLNIGNNNSSTTTSSTTTAEKTASTAANKSTSSTVAANGRLTNNSSGITDAENLIIRLDPQQQEAVCALVSATGEMGNHASGRRWSSNIQQTDL